MASSQVMQEPNGLATIAELPPEPTLAASSASSSAAGSQPSPQNTEDTAEGSTALHEVSHERPRPSSRSTLRSSRSTSAGEPAAPGPGGTARRPTVRPYAAPPGLAAEPEIRREVFPSRYIARDDPANHSSASIGKSSFSSFGAEPRPARISSEPPIPPEIHLLLMTTPPPAPRTTTSLRPAASSSLITGPAAFPPSNAIKNDSRAAVVRRDDSVSSLAARMRSFRFLGGGGNEKPAESAPARTRSTDLASASPRAIPRTRQSQDATTGTPEREKRKRTAERKGGRLDSRSPADVVPRTWSDYALAYASGQMDISDPPFPPVDAQQLGPAPYDLAHFSAPLDLASTSPIRNRLVERLDLLGRNRRPSDPYSSNRSYGTPSLDTRRSSRASTTPSAVHSISKHAGEGRQHPLSWLPSLLGDPALTALLSRALYAPLGTPALFKPSPKAAMITLFPPTSEPAAPVTIVASLNLPANLGIPLSHAIDAHVLLNGERGLVVPDTERDWRFRGNDLVCPAAAAAPGGPYTPSSSGTGKGLGIRFYAAMPVFAPSLPELAAYEEEAGGRIAIGTIAILDDWPRMAKFGSSERAKLRSLASEVTREIERFLRERGDLSRLSSEQSSPPSSMRQLPPPIPDVHPEPVDPAAAEQAAFFAGRVQAEDPRADAPPNGRMASRCALLAETLDLSLVYVVQLDLSRCPPPPAITGPSQLTLLAAHNLPTDSQASFDPALHLRALRAPEGGLLFRSPVDSPGKFASGVLLPIAETPAGSPDGVWGWVVAGYTVERDRKWGAEEMAAFEQARADLLPLLITS